MNAKIRSWLTATLVALATMAIVVVANWPNYLEAKDPATAGKVAKALITTPTMTVRGCKLSILPLDKAAKPDDEYVVSIKAENTTDKPVTFDMKVAVHSTSQAFLAVSRSAPIPRKSWQREYPVSLGPGETTIIKVATGKKASALGALPSPQVTVDGKHLYASPFGGLRMLRGAPQGRTPNGRVPVKPIKKVAPKRTVRAKAGG